MIFNLNYMVKTFPQCPVCGKYPVIINNERFCEILCTECRSKVKEPDQYSAIEKWKDFTIKGKVK